MVSDRISLVKIYNALLPIQANVGDIDEILLNRTTEWGIKSIPKFHNLNELKEYIEDLYPYRRPTNCNCLTKNEGVYEILSFSFKNDRGETTFVNNLPDYFQTSKPQNINTLLIKGLNNHKQNIIDLSQIYKDFVCYPYLEWGYMDCDYIEIIRNEVYNKLIDLYKNTKYVDA